jgi:hypothetical protein
MRHSPDARPRQLDKVGIIIDTLRARDEERHANGVVCESSPT